MPKIKFERYDVTLKGRNYCVLIPPGTDELWVGGYGDKYWGVDWYGSRKGLEALLYSSVVFGFNPTNKIVYLPIRHNHKPRHFDMKDSFPGEQTSLIQDYDYILTTHQTQFKRSQWKAIKHTMRYMKPKTYVLQYDEERTKRYFQTSLDKWKNKTVCNRKEYLLEILQGHVLFHVFSRMVFRQVYLDIQEFLEEDLEKEFMDDREFLPISATWPDSACFYYREKKQMNQHPWFYFFDEKLEEVANQNNKEKKEKEEI